MNKLFNITNESNFNPIDWNQPVMLIDEEFVVQTSYNAFNRPTLVTQLDNTVVTNKYDKGGLLNQVLHNGTTYINNIVYNAKGQREHIYYGNNTKTKYEYNPLNFRLTRLLTTRNTGAVVLQDLNYEFDAVGNIIKQTDHAQQTNYFNNAVIAPVCTYEYDALYRLVKATGRELTALTNPNQNDFANNIPVPNPAANAMRNYTHQYQYDALGNMLKDAWKTNQYATANNYLLGSNNIANQYTYDAHGNMLKMPHLTNMAWDYQDQLISATNGTFTSYYNYDAQGNRTRKVVVKGTVREERYYIGGYEVYRKYTGTTLNLERKTVNVSDDEKVFVRNEGGVVRYQYDNHLGSACLELDSAGLVISYEEYHPFGTTSYRSGRNEQEVSLKRYKYCGKERDEETGLYYYGMRYYAGWICRFVSVDPLQFKYPELTPFQYASNRPITGVDRDGLEFYPNPYDMALKELEGLWNYSVDRIKSWFQFDNSDNKDTETSPLQKVLNLLPEDVQKSIQEVIQKMATKIASFDFSRVAIGIEYSGGLEATSAIKLETNAISGKVIFLGGDDAGYVYEYYGGEIGVGGETSVGANANLGISYFIAYQHDKNSSKKEFDGSYKYGRLGAGVSTGSILGGIDIGLSGSVTYAEGNAWTLISVGGNVSLGAGVNTVVTGSGTGGKGNIKLTESPSSKTMGQKIRSFFHLLNPLPGSVFFK